MDISIQVKGVQLPGASTDSSKAHFVGDITDVYSRATITESPSLNSSLVFVHVTGVPVSNIQDAWFLNEPTYGPLDENNVRPVINKHEFYFDLALATNEEIIGLTNNREIATTWARTKQVLKRRSTGQLITDADLNG